MSPFPAASGVDASIQIGQSPAQALEVPANMYTWQVTATPIPLRTIASEPYADILPGGKSMTLTAIVIARKNYNPFSGLAGQPQIKIGTYQDVVLTVYTSPGNPNFKQVARANKAYVAEWRLTSDSAELSVYMLTAYGNWKFQDFGGQDA